MFDKKIFIVKILIILVFEVSMSVISNQIKNYRLLRGMSQRQLGDKLDKTSAVISNWEKGVNSPDLDNVEKLCHVLSCTPNELFGWDVSEELETFLKEKQKLAHELDKLIKARAELDKQIENFCKDLNGKSLYIEYDRNDPDDMDKISKLPTAIKRRTTFRDITNKETPN